MKMDEGILNRITADPEIFGGKPIIRRMPISVELIQSLLAQGESMEAILDDYPELEPTDIWACIAYAHAVIANDRIEPVKGLLSGEVSRGPLRRATSGGLAAPAKS
jgi:uncharacterized protein (DUF433 family)